ncbi:hypothetical protein P4O66_017240, partial [Electrophorus voltai]
NPVKSPSRCKWVARTSPPKNMPDDSPVGCACTVALTPEEAAMEAYITEALQHGFIRSSTSPVTAGFFVEKKGGGLRPCIAYWTLNEVTVNYSYPLPLIFLTHE